MVKGRFDSGELQRVSGQFTTKAGELDTLINQAKSAMTSLEASWEGPRKTRTFNEWQNMQKNLLAAVDTLRATSKFLKDAATAYEAVEGASS